MTDRPLEYCSICSVPTGRAGAGEDSIFWLDGEIGPLCDGCHDRLQEEAMDNIGTPTTDDLREALEALDSFLFATRPWKPTDYATRYFFKEAVTAAWAVLAKHRVQKAREAIERTGRQP